jgi:predicted nucleotidyltransferase
MPRKFKKVLRELKKGLVEIYVGPLKAIYLFGSFARGVGKLPDSDIDVMIILNEGFRYRDARKRSIAFVAALCLENNVGITRKLASPKEYEVSQTSFLSNTRYDTVVI